mgnify:CR=1 FL=1
MSKKRERLFIVIDLLLAATLLISLSKVIDIQMPDQTGQIEQEARKIANVCLATEGDREKCYKEKFTQLLRDKDIFFAQKTLYAIQNIDPKLRHCHVISHEISKAATRQNPSKWRELMERVDVDTCGAGFLHGILEAHTGDEPNFKIDANFINETCYKGQKNFKERTCSHILGHLILLDTEGKIEPALPICGAIDSSFQLDCYNGIFMEESFKLALAEHGFADIPVRDRERMERQQERCFKYGGTPAVACWTDMAEIFVEYYNYDPVKGYELCNKAPFEAARNHCYLKAVILMAVSPRFDTKEQLLKACSFYTNDENVYKRCTSFIISSLMHYSPKFADRGVKLCSNIADAYGAYCFEELGNKLKMNVSEKGERERLCRGTPEKYKSLCAS